VPATVVRALQSHLATYSEPGTTGGTSGGVADYLP